MDTTVFPLPQLSSKDFASDQEVKWCPGCGDYSILKQVQTIFPELPVRKEDYVFISGIGCSSRFTYYMDTYGVHSIHGRACAIASGVKSANPDLSVWIATGDGDALAIGGNHFIHLMRRNLDVNMLMFNNQIYSLTKGQYSPTSEHGKVTKSSPFGTIEDPFNPAELALGAHASFVARTMDRDTKHLQAMIRRAYEHKGTSFVEVYQNCPVFNDGTFEIFTDKGTKKEETIYVEHGKPLMFGQENEKGIRFDGLIPRIVSMSDGTVSADDLWIHDEGDKTKANILARFLDDPHTADHFPRAFGVFYVDERPTYDEEMKKQLQYVAEKKGRPSLDKILSGDKTWEIV